MTDKELADKVVALGIGKVLNGLFFLMGAHDEPVDAEFFVRDWRVAGALMEKTAKRGRTIALSFGCDVFNATDAESATPTYGVYLERPNKSGPRAIIEACVEALSD